MFYIVSSFTQENEIIEILIIPLIYTHVGVLHNKGAKARNRIIIFLAVFQNLQLKHHMFDSKRTCILLKNEIIIIFAYLY